MTAQTHCTCPSPRWHDDPDFVCEWCEAMRENLDFEAALEATLRPCDPDEDLPPFDDEPAPFATRNLMEPHP